MARGQVIVLISIQALGRRREGRARHGGGVKINIHGRVLGPNNTHIIGLFAAGETVGTVHGNNRGAGGALSECLTFGYIAGTNIADNALNPPQP